MMKKIKDMPAEQRPRERLEKNGARGLQDYELLAIILGRGVQGNDVQAIAKELVEILDKKALDFELRDIESVRGIGFAKATSIAAAVEFVRRRMVKGGFRITEAKDVYYLIRHYAHRKQEQFISLSLDGANEVIQIRRVTVGLVNRTQVHPREVFADIIADRAASVIIAHNHPSGNLSPSDDDIVLTKRLKESADLLGIKLLDHVIFSVNGYESFAESGML